jgi:hypothetical protein
MGANMVSPASTIMEHTGLNNFMNGGGDFASTIAGHMGPIFALGSLGVLGSIGAGMAGGKLLKWLAKRKAAKRMAQQPQQTAYRNPILGM